LVGYKNDFREKRKYINHTETGQKTGQTLKSHTIQSKLQKMLDRQMGVGLDNGLSFCEVIKMKGDNLKDIT